MVNLRNRSYEEESMDDLTIGGPIIDQTLRELDTINKYLGGDAVTISALKSLVNKNTTIGNGEPIRIMDMGCGGGDMLLKVANWAKKIGIEVELIGIDANPHIIEYAKNHCASEKIEFRCENVLEHDLGKDSVDIILSTLFLHHFDNDQCLFLVQKWCVASKIGVVVNDIHRHPIAYYSIKWLTGIFSKSAMVRNDAAVSVQRAFRRNELRKLLPNSNNYKSKISWHWAFRWKVLIGKANPESM